MGQIFVLQECGVTKVTLVAGYGHEVLEGKQFVKKVNSDWANTSSGASLKLALSDDMENDDLLVIYGDTIFDPDTINQVIQSKHDYTICSKTDPSALFHEYSVIKIGELLRIEKDKQESFSVFTGIFFIKKHRIGIHYCYN